MDVRGTMVDRRGDGEIMRELQIPSHDQLPNSLRTSSDIGQGQTQCHKEEGGFN